MEDEKNPNEYHFSALIQPGKGSRLIINVHIFGRRPVRWENYLERPNQAWVPRSYYALNRDEVEGFVAFGSTGAAGSVVLASPSPILWCQKSGGFLVGLVYVLG